LKPSADADTILNDELTAVLANDEGTTPETVKYLDYSLPAPGG
jgi:hypothetical protein